MEYNPKNYKIIVYTCEGGRRGDRTTDQTIGRVYWRTEHVYSITNIFSNLEEYDRLYSQAGWLPEPRLHPEVHARRIHKLCATCTNTDRTHIKDNSQSDK